MTESYWINKKIRINISWLYNEENLLNNELKFVAKYILWEVKLSNKSSLTSTVKS